MKIGDEIIHDLLEIKAVQINPEHYFTWTPGIKSPIYCDNRLTMSYPVVRRKIIDAFVEKVKDFEEQVDVIAGCATAGIPHAAWLAERLDLPMVYVRSKPKGHGKGNKIEGLIQPGQNVLVIEDLISTGGSSIESAKALQQAGANVLGVLAIFTYGLEKSKEQFRAANISFQTITNYDALVEQLVTDHRITEQQQAELIKWRNQL